MTGTNTRIAIIVGLLIGLSTAAAAQEQNRVKELEKAQRADEANRKKADAEDPQTPAQLNRPIPEMRFDGAGLEDAIDFLRDVTGANIFVHWKAIEKAGLKKNTPATAALKNVTFRTALTKVLESASTEKAKLGFTTDDGVIVISIAGADPAAKVTGKLPPEADRPLPEVNFNGVPFADVVDFLRDVSGANIFVNWNEFKRAGIEKDAPVTVRLREAKFSTVIRTVLASVSDGKTPLRFKFEDNVITINTGPLDEKKPAK